MASRLMVSVSGVRGEIGVTLTPEVAERFGAAFGTMLGAGKTVLVRGIAAGLGLGDERLVSSPTYVLVHEYPADVPLYHVDLYRMADPAAELAGLGLDEMLADGVVVIEWADRAGGALPQPRWEIDIEIVAERGRRFAVRRVE